MAVSDLGADPAVLPPTGPVNTVQPYKDGVGNIINAIQLDDNPTTVSNILAWTKRAHVNAKGQVKIQNDHLMWHVGLNDWLVMDSRRFEQVFPMTNPQFRATYTLPTGGPIPLGIEVPVPPGPTLKVNRNAHEHDGSLAELRERSAEAAQSDAEL